MNSHAYLLGWRGNGRPAEAGCIRILSRTVSDPHAGKFLAANPDMVSYGKPRLVHTPAFGRRPALSDYVAPLQDMRFVMDQVADGASRAAGCH